MEFRLPIMFIMLLLETVFCQQQVGSFYFPVTVAPPPFEIPKPDRTDTVYDETVQIVQDTDDLPAKDNLIRQKETWPEESFPPVYNTMWRKQKNIGTEIYKTDAEMTQNEVQVHPESLYPTRANKFVADSGLQMEPTHNSIRPNSMGSEAKITMTQTTKMAKTFKSIKEAQKKPNKATRVDAEIHRRDTDSNQTMAVEIPRMHEDLQKLIQEVNLLKTLVNKLMRHIYRKNKRRVNRKAPQHLFAKQSLDNSVTEHFTGDGNRTDTVYDETVQIVQYTDHLPVNDNLIRQKEKRPEENFPPVYNTMWRKQKNMGTGIYKTDAEMTQNEVQVNPESLYPSRANKFVADSGLQMQPTHNSVRPSSMGSEAKITMTQTTKMAKAFESLKKAQKKPNKATRIDAEIHRRDADFNQSVAAEIPKMHDDLQKLIQEVNLLKTLVNKLMRHIYRKNKRRVNRKAPPPPQHLFAKQSLDNSVTEHFTGDGSK